MMIATKKSTIDWIKWIAVFAIPLMIIVLLPTSEAFTVPMRNFLAVTLWGILMYMFELIDNAVTSILLVFGYVIFGIAPLNVALSAWTAGAVWMTFGCFALIAIVQKTTLLKRLAYFCVIASGGTYSGIIFAMITLGIVIKFILPGCTTGIAMLALAYSIVKALNLEKSKAGAGIIMAMLLGFMDSGVGYMPDYFSVLFANVGTVTSVPVSMTSFAFHNLIFLPLIYLIGFLLTKYFKPEIPISSKAYFREQLTLMGSIEQKEKKILMVLLLFMVYLLTESYHGFPMLYGFIIAPFIMYFPGIDVGESEDLKHINYSVMLFMTACMTIGNVAAYVEIGPFISAMLLPYLQNTSTSGFFALIWIIIAFLNLLMTPMAEFAALGAPIAQLCVDLGINPYPMIYTFIQGGSTVIFPYEYTMGLVAFSFGIIKMKDFVKVVIVKNIICFVFLMTAGITYWKLIGLL